MEEKDNLREPTFSGHFKASAVFVLISIVIMFLFVEVRVRNLYSKMTIDTTIVGVPVSSDRDLGGDLGAVSVDIELHGGFLPPAVIGEKYEHDLFLRNLGMMMAGELSLIDSIESDDWRNRIVFRIETDGSQESVPPGITLSSDGILGGVPVASGTYRFSVVAMTRDRLQSTRRQFRLSIDDRRSLIARPEMVPPFIISFARVPIDSILPDATNGRFYSAELLPMVQLINAGGRRKSDLIWLVESGSLPDGLLLDPLAGVISGTPLSRGRATFYVRASVQGVAAAQLFELNVN
jgi:hypothetical protein